MYDLLDAFNFFVRKFYQKVIQVHQIYTISFNKLINKTLRLILLNKDPLNIDLRPIEQG